MAGIVFHAALEIPDDVEVLGIPVYDDLTVPEGAGVDVDEAYLRRCGFEGRPGQAQVVPAEDGSSVVALGVGPSHLVDGDVIRRAGAALARAAGRAKTVATTLPAATEQTRRVTSVGAATVEGIGLAAYRFAGARTKPPETYLETVTVVGAEADDVRAGAVAVEATTRARDWVNQPPRQLTPTRLGELAVEVGTPVGVTVEVWDAARIAAERLGGLAGVAAGAEEPACLIRMAYEPPDATATVALVGKGITFDSGGLSLKPPGSMMTMKSDMGGAAAVIAAVAGAAALELGVRVVGWVAATENMPSGTAIHPGDVLVARNGTTIEVLNTDAEGRLVLADALSLAAEEHPDAIIDVATLTGAQRIALGSGVAAVMGNDDLLVNRLIAAGESAGEPLWRLPLVAAYRSQLDSEVADLKNVAAAPAAGTIMAGLFLQEFVDGLPWAHLDIAAPSWSESDDGWLTKGGTGWGARTLLQLLSEWW
jgi:leucyl aminopeptidase